MRLGLVPAVPAVASSVTGRRDAPQAQKWVDAGQLTLNPAGLLQGSQKYWHRPPCGS